MSWTRSTVKASPFLGAKRTIQVLGASLALLLVSLPLFPQANQGTIQGSVFDQTGGAIAGATVTVIDVARGVSRPLVSDSAGAFVAGNLIPGTYTVRGEAKGFQTLERANVLLEVGQTVRVDLVLQPGAQTQTVTVTSEAPSVNSSDAVLGGTVSQQSVSDLPMNGRDFHTFLSLRPGIETVEGGGIESVSANGLRSSDTGYLVDGLRVDESYTGNSLVNSATPYGSATGLPFDAIQEINNQENPKAEDGWKPAAIINIGLKSGTNNLHGTAFALGRDTSLDARNFFNTPPNPKAPIEFEQFGAGAGDKIIKDKLFWFADYEGQRINVASVAPSTLLVTTSLGNCIIGSAVGCGNPAVSLVDACLSLVNGGNGSKITPLSAQLAGLNRSTCAVAPTNFTPGASESLYPSNSSTSPIYPECGNTYGNDNGIGKLDYHINDHNSINGYFGYLSGVGNTSGSDCVTGTSNSPFNSEVGPVTAELYSANWTWTPTAERVNEVRVGYSHFYQPYFSNDLNVNPLAYGINTGVTDPRIFGAPGVAITGFESYGGGQHKIVGPDGGLQLLDHYSLVHGNHTFKVGGEFLDNSVSSYPNSGGKGSFSFTTITNYLEGNVNSGKISVGDPTRNLNNYQYALFGQDDWRVTRKIIVNLGLRWEYSSVLTEAHDLLGNFDPNLGLVQVGDQIKTPYSGDFKNFSPRLGLAWDIFGNGRTVLRAGASLMYSYLPIQMFASQDQVLGITQAPTGATIVTQGACAAGCPGSGTIALANQSLTGGNATQLTTNWNLQTTACVSGGTTACGPIFPASTFKVQCGDGLPATGGGTDPAPCIMMAVNPNLTSPYVGTWTLGVQRAITNALTLDVTYVGTAGRDQAGFVDINQAALGSGFTTLDKMAGDPSVSTHAVESAAEQASRPYYSKFPYLSYIDELVNNSRSNYNALQMTLSQRPWHGLSFVAGYTFAHMLDNSPTSTFNPLPPDSLNPQQQYGDSDFDIRNRFTLTTTYLLPGKKGFGQMLEGWQINSVVKLAGGEPWSPQDTANDLNGTGEVLNLDYYGQTWNFVGNPADFSHTTSIPFACWKGSSAAAGLKGCPTTFNNMTLPPPQCMNAAEAGGANAVASMEAIGCYYVGNSVLIPPALGTDGDAARGIFRGPGFYNWDLSIIKDWKFKERYDAQFRAEIYNALNNPNFYSLQGVQGTHGGSQFNYPNKGASGNFGCTCITPDQAIGNIVVGTGGPREIDLGLKLIW